MGDGIFDFTLNMCHFEDLGLKISVSALDIRLRAQDNEQASDD